MLSISLSSASLSGHAWSHVFKAIPNGCPTGISNLATHYAPAPCLPISGSSVPAALPKEGVSLEPLASLSSAPASLASVGHLFWSIPSCLLTGLPAASLIPTIHPPRGLPTGASPEKCQSEHATPRQFPTGAEQIPAPHHTSRSCIFSSFLSNSALRVPPSLCREWLPRCYVSPLITQGLAALPGARLRRPLNARCRTQQ